MTLDRMTRKEFQSLHTYFISPVPPVRVTLAGHELKPLTNRGVKPGAHCPADFGTFDFLTLPAGAHAIKAQDAGPGG